MATTAIPANCAAVTNALLAESGRLGGRMYMRSVRKRPILKYQMSTRGAWMNGMGFSYSAVTFERSFAPLTGDPWTTITASDGDSTDACRPPTDTVAFGQTTRTVTPRHYAINTQHFCIRDIQFDWQYAEWMTKVSNALAYIPEWVWARRFTQDYFTNAGHHLTLNIANGTQDDPSAYNVSNLPTAPLSLGVLNNIKLDLDREGGETAAGVDDSTNEPVFTVIGSAEIFDSIIRDNPNLRQDVRYATMGRGEDAPTYPGIKVKRRNYAGWVFEADPFPRRFTFSGGAYLEIAPFVQSATTKGYKWEQNPLWQQAPYEEAIVWHEECYQDLAVNTAENIPADWKFTPQNWMGSFSVRNILHETCNPDGSEIFFRSLFASAARPINPKVGWTILYARCGLPTDLHTCSSSS
jgi:hypothetical protein